MLKIYERRMARMEGKKGQMDKIRPKDNNYS